MKTKLKELAKSIFIVLISILIVGSIYYKTNFAEQEFEELVFHIINGAGSTSLSVVNMSYADAVIGCNGVTAFDKDSDTISNGIPLIFSLQPELPMHS